LILGEIGVTKPGVGILGTFGIVLTFMVIPVMAVLFTLLINVSTKAVDSTE
jgi:hypothetical protein